MEKAIWTGNGWRIRWTDGKGKRRNAGGFSSQGEAEYFGQQKALEARGVKLRLRTGSPIAISFESLAAKWLDERAIAKRSMVADELIIRVHLMPFFQTLKIHEINVSHGQRYTALKKQALSLKTVHNRLTLLISMLNYAQASGWLSKVPEIQKPALGRAPTGFSKIGRK